MPAFAVLLVLDTNTVVSGLLWQGAPGKLVDAALAEKVTLAASVAMLSELRGVLSREKFAGRLTLRGTSAEALVDRYIRIVTIVVPAAIPATVSRDPDDDRVLAAAVGGAADLIVSGDRHLLDLGSFRGIGIVMAAEALTMLDAPPAPFV